MQINTRLRSARLPPSPTRNHPMRRMYHVTTFTAKDITRDVAFVRDAGSLGEIRQGKV